jgi:hypothetical protein
MLSRTDLPPVTSLTEAARRRLEKPQLQAFLCCDWVNTTENGKANLIGIFDRLLVSGVPTSSPSFFLYARIALAAPVPIAVRILGPSGEEVGRLDGMPVEELSEEFGAVSLQTMLRMKFPINTLGTHWLELHADNELLTTLPLAVDISPFKVGP